MKTKLLFFKMVFLSIFFASHTYGQVPSYTFAQSAGTYSDLAGGTVLAIATGNLTTTSVDSYMGNLPTGSFPFTFSFNGVGYTGCNISSNGFITFGATAALPTATTPLSGTVAYDGAISVWGRDLNAPFALGGKTGEISWGVVGTAPNREIVIQWKDFRPTFSTSLTLVPFLNFQIRLQETSNAIVMRYGSSGLAVGATNTSSTAQIGLRGSNNVFATSVNNRTNLTTTSFNSSSAGTLNSSTQSFATVTATPGMPSNGLTYTWTPPACFVPAALTNNLTSQTDANHSWSVFPAPSNGYQYEVSTSPTPPAVGTPTMSSTYSSTGLTPNTTYYLHVRSDCGGTFSAWSTASFYTGYCLPSSTNQLSWVSVFNTTGASSNINYTSPSGFLGGYNNLTATTLSNFAGNPTNVSLTAGGPTCGFAIWVDWNNDFVFSPAEKMFNTTGFVTTTSGSFSAPGGTPLGNYRMRLVVDFNASNPANPCATITRGEFIDFTYQVVAPPTCMVPTALTNTLVTTSAVNHAWTPPGSGTTPTGYEWAFTTSATPPASGAPTAGTTASSTGLALGTYYLHVRSDCGLGDISSWATSAPFVLNYCTPTYSTGKTLGDLISNVTVVGTTLDNNSGTAQVNPAYTYFNTLPNHTGDLAAGTSYIVSISVGTWGNQFIKAWIDYNDNLVFEPSEQIGSSTIAPGQSNTGPFPAANFTITLNCSPPPGIHRMRIRSNWNSATFDACSAQSFGECEDYDVNILPPPPCPEIGNLATNTVTSTSANVTWTVGCIETVWDVDVSTSATPSGSPSNPGVTANPFAATSLTPNTLYYVHVRANCGLSGGSGQSIWSTTSFTTPPPPPANDECSGALPLTVNSNFVCTSVTAGTVVGATESADGNTCFGTDDDDVWFSFVATNTAHRVSILNAAGSTTDMYHVVYGGSCGALSASLVCSDADVSNLTGLTIGATYYVRVYTWTATINQTTTFNVCIGTPPPPPANDECAAAISVAANPTLVCTAFAAGTVQSATASAQANGCFGTADDDVWYSFVATNSVHTINLNNVTGSTTDLFHSVYAAAGGCGSLGTELLCSDPNNSLITGLTVGATYFVRVYTWTATVGQSSAFEICIGTPPPPPANDECSNAVSLTVNPNYVCSSVTNGTVQSSTPSAEPNSCFGTDDDDVWYSFVATNTSHRVSLVNISGSTTDMYHAVFDGAGGCGSLGTAITCSDPNISNLTGLTIGNTYYVRVYTWTATIGQTSVFDICIGTPPPPPANDNCSSPQALTVNADYLCGASTPGTVASATASVEANACANVNDDDDVWYSFVATNPIHRVSLINIDGQGGSTDLYHVVYDASGGCGALTQVLCSDPNVSDLTGLTVGATYFVRVYTNLATVQSTTFNVCIGTPPAPPANDECAAAFSFGTLSSTQSCQIVELESATLSQPTCLGTGTNDVWYTFTIPASAGPGAQVFYSTTNITGLTNRVFQVLSACGGTSLFCSDPEAGSWTLNPGTYRLRAHTFAVGTSRFNLCLTIPVVPVNDNICNALTIRPVSGRSLNTYGQWGGFTCSNRVTNTQLATATGANEGSCGLANGKSVWYKFTTPTCVVGGVVPFQIEMTTDNAQTSIDTKIQLFSSSDGLCSGTLTSINCVDDAVSAVTVCGGTSTLSSTIVSAALLPNTNYFVLVDGYNGASGIVEVSGRAISAPHTATSPSPTTVSMTTPNKGAASNLFYVRPVGGPGYSVSATSALTSTATVANGASYETQLEYRCTASSNQWYRSPMVTVAVPTTPGCTAVTALNCAPGAVSGYTLSWPEVSGLFTNGGLLSGYILYYQVVGQPGVSVAFNPTPVCSGGTCTLELPSLTDPAGYVFYIKTRCSASVVLTSNITTCAGAKSATNDVFTFVNPTTGTEYHDVKLTDDWGDFGLSFADLGSYFIGINKENEIFATKIGEADMMNFGDDVSFELVPNPTNASTTMTFNNTIKSGTFTVVDALGRTISSGAISNSSAVELDGSKWNAGVYLVNVTTNDKTTMRRLVISK